MCLMPTRERFLAMALLAEPGIEQADIRDFSSRGCPSVIAGFGRLIVPYSRPDRIDSRAKIKRATKGTP
jgi:hypothetical protein